MSTSRPGLATRSVLVALVAAGCITTVPAASPTTVVVTPSAIAPTSAPTAAASLAPPPTIPPTLAPVPTSTALVTAPPLVTVPPTHEPVTQAPDATADPWALSATGLRDQIGEEFPYHCSPNGQPRTVWGTDTYTDDSSICTAAVHAGLITLAGGGEVTIQIAPGQESYEGTERNGITSLAYGAWGGSFVFVTD